MQRQIWHHSSHSVPRPSEPPALPFRVELEIVRGQARQRIRPIRNPAFLIGTADDCDLVLGDPQFAEVHAYIRIAAEGVSLRHLGFAPALTVNGDVATHVNLADGDRIRTGPYEFVVHVLPPAAGDDQRGHAPLQLPAALDRVEDAVGNVLVQQLLAQIREELLPAAARLRLFVDPDGGASLPAAGSLSSSSDLRQAYARSS